jgi:hypothetical protein
MMSIASPLGCHGFESGRTPSISAICGNCWLTALAARTVLGCNPASDATPTGSASGISGTAAAGGGATSPGGTPGGAAIGGAGAVGGGALSMIARCCGVSAAYCASAAAIWRSNSLNLACSSARTSAAFSAAAVASAADLSDAWAAVAARSRADWKAFI